MMMLGEDFEKALAAKFGGDKDAAFAALDTGWLSFVSLFPLFLSSL